MLKFNYTNYYYAGDTMDYKVLGKILNNKKLGLIGEDTEYRRFSVMIPFVKNDDEYSILLEVRSKHLNSQPGEISFPGGGIEEGEENLEAAIRETCEELGTDEDNIGIIGPLDILVTQHSKIIYPFAGYLRDMSKIAPSKDEVDHVFSVPLKFFMEQEPVVKTIRILSEPDEDFPYVEGVQPKEYRWDVGRSKVYFYKYQNYVIWGLTAKIIHHLVTILKKEA